jgi:hypothetical protein
MKSISFSRNSWHFKLLCLMNERYSWREPKDLCAYIRAFSWSLLKVAFIMLFIVSAVTLLGFALFSAGACETGMTKTECGNFLELQYGSILIGIYSFICGSSFIALAALTCTILWYVVSFLGTIITGYLEDVRKEREGREPKPEAEPNFIKLAYQSIKTKTCFRLEFK